MSASDLDCGTVCARQYGYGKSLTLTAAPNQGSVFSGWNGVCSKTQTTCTVPVGPITSIKAVFDKDTSPPSSPGDLSWRHVGDAHRHPDPLGTIDRQCRGRRATACTSTMRRRVTRPTRRTRSATWSAAIGTPSRSTRPTRTAIGLRDVAHRAHPACRLAARLAGVGIDRRGGGRYLVVKLRVNRPTAAQLALTRGRTVVAHGRYGVKPGTNSLRLAVPGGSGEARTG